MRGKQKWECKHLKKIWIQTYLRCPHENSIFYRLSFMNLLNLGLPELKNSTGRMILCDLFTSYRYIIYIFFQVVIKFSVHFAHLICITRQAIFSSFLRQSNDYHYDKYRPFFTYVQKTAVLYKQPFSVGLVVLA